MLADVSSCCIICAHFSQHSFGTDTTCAPGVDINNQRHCLPLLKQSALNVRPQSAIDVLHNA